MGRWLYNRDSQCKGRGEGDSQGRDWHKQRADRGGKERELPVGHAQRV